MIADIKIVTMTVKSTALFFPNFTPPQIDDS